MTPFSPSSFRPAARAGAGLLVPALTLLGAASLMAEPPEGADPATAASQPATGPARPASERGLVIRGGRPVLTAGGRPRTAIYSETLPRGMHRRNAQMAKAGVDTFILIVQGGHRGDFWTTFFWRGPGKWGDESDASGIKTLNEQAQAILEVEPDARFLVRWMSKVPKGWGVAHPTHMQATDEKRLRSASHASKLALEGRKEMARRIVNYCEAQSWGDRVIGYLPFGPNEGQMPLTIHETMFDQSGAALEAYVDYLKDQYESNAALQEAWGDEEVIFTNVTVPDAEEWRSEQQSWMHWPDPDKTQRFRDFFLAMRRTLAAQIAGEVEATHEAAEGDPFVATDALKHAMMGWLILDSFKGAGHGMDWRNYMLGSGSVDAGPMLDQPELDALITPADYSARSVGFGWGPEGLSDSLVLRDKTILVEDDARSWAAGGHTQGAWRNPEEARAGLMRNLAIAASRGMIPYWMNVGGGFFDDPEMLEIVEKQIPVRRKLLTRPLERTEHAVALILDDRSPLYEDFTAGFQNLAVLRQRVDELGNTGLPWRVFLLSDLKRENFPKYRCYIVPNLFHMTPEKKRLIREKLFRDGSITIFGPGTGIVRDTDRSAEPASDLLGFPLELQMKSASRRVLVYGGNHEALASLEGPFTYGDSYPYGPILEPAADIEKHGAVELGKVSAWWGSNRAGLVLKEFGKGAAGNGTPGPRDGDDYAVAFSMAVPIPARVVRSLARYAGMNLWSERGNVAAANGNMVAVHSMRGGRHTVRLPAPSTVRDATTGRIVAERAERFEFKAKAPFTRVFLYERSEP